MADDPYIEQAEKAEQEVSGDEAARAANRLDIRRFIGLLLGIYGVILTVLGIGASDADIDKAAGINLNLWTGVALLVVSALFFAWALIRPLSRELGDGA
jgi:drug/metabolite transporter (DMT)-like permease